MNCDRCGERPGGIRYTEYEGGQARKLMICPECAEELGFGPLPTSDPDTPDADATKPPQQDSQPPDADEPTEEIAPDLGGGGVPPGVPVFGPIELQMALTEGIPPAERDRRKCAGCGLTVGDLRSLLGCPRCYDTFSEALDLLLERLHGSVRHRGRLPHGRVAEPGDDST